MSDSKVTIHMVASLDGFIARKDGAVDWMETSDAHAEGVELSSEEIATFLATIDCYVLGARTYETALGFETKGQGWAYGDKPVYVLTHRDLPRTRESVHFVSGDLAELVNAKLRPRHRTIWFVGGGAIAAECVRAGLCDEIRYTVAPVLIGEGIRFFERIEKDVALHLVETKAYKNGLVALRYEVKVASAAPSSIRA
jgi:dihydrofolate reductase